MPMGLTIPLHCEMRDALILKHVIESIQEVLLFQLLVAQHASVCLERVDEMAAVQFDGCHGSVAVVST